jgi:protein ImuA
MRAPQPDDRPRVLAELREAIRQLEHRPARRSGIVGCGLAEVDRALPGGGFPRGAISELAGGLASGKTAVALALLASLAGEDLSAWVDGCGEIYPPAAAARGVDLARLLIVRPAAGARGGPVQAALWASEALLGSGAFAAVVMDIPTRRAERGWEAVARRLQAAAEKGGAVGLWLAPPRAALRVPAAVRLEVAEEGGQVRARRKLGDGERTGATHAA